MSAARFNSTPDHAPPTSQSFSGQIPVRFNGAPDGPFSGETKWRGVKDFEHATLCRVFQLDPARFYFDLPSTVRGIGANMSGVAGAHAAGRRLLNGYVMMAGHDEPVAKLTVCFESERFTDRDPFNRNEFFDLSRS